MQKILCSGGARPAPAEAEQTEELSFMMLPGMPGINVYIVSFS